MIIRGQITVVSRDVEEDSEEFWDRAWAFSAAIAAGGKKESLESRNAHWAESFKKHHEKNGVIY